MKKREINSVQLKAAIPTLESGIDELWCFRNLILGPQKYYESLTVHHDAIVQVAAVLWLIENNHVSETVRGKIRDLHKYEIIREKAFLYFLRNGETQEARSLIGNSNEPGRIYSLEIQKSIFYNDLTEAARLRELAFFQTGQIVDLDCAARETEQANGWKEAVKKYTRLMIIEPQNMAHFQRLGQILKNANQNKLLKDICNIVDTIEIFPNLSKLYKSHILSVEGDHKQGLKLFETIEFKKFSSHFQIIAHYQKSEMLRRAEQFRESFKELNNAKSIQRKECGHQDAFIKEIEKRKQLTLPETENIDINKNYFFLLGFPRSGTTLLENILDAHPEIETLEEIGGFQSVISYINRVYSNDHVPANFVQSCQDYYYSFLERYIDKTREKIIIDKLPSLSAEAELLSKIFPEKKYIFCIRHPYDVILSCFQQHFVSNIAMNAFLTFEDTCKTYDYTMSQWFKFFSLNSKNVHYIYYHELILDFQNQIKSALSFLGAETNVDLDSFSKLANKRGARTPSYAKVRQGLSIGVQSSWKNYQFVFEKGDARKLDKWVEFFGYNKTNL